MRGKEMNDVVTLIDRRITPAYAGKSGCFVAATLIAIGSPPPMRGKASSTPIISVFDRITPAYAGKSYAVGNAANFQ